MKLMILNIVIVLFLLLQVSAEDVFDGKKSLVGDSARGRMESNEQDELEMVSLKQLFASATLSDKLASWKNQQKTISVKDFSKILLKEVKNFSGTDFEEIRKAISNAEKLNIATIGLECIKSSNHALRFLGFELLIQASTEKIQYFKPTEFHKAFKERGGAARPFLIDIILQTDDDYAREWAYELNNEIFYNHYTADDSIQKRKYVELKQKEAEIYKKLAAVFAKPGIVQKIIESNQVFSDSIRQSMGVNVRQSMRLKAVIKLLDNINKKNPYAIKSQLLKTIQPDNFDFNILNRSNGQPQKLPPVPEVLKLRYLSKAILSRGSTNTYKWLPKARGGFSLEDVKTAIKSKNISRITWMRKTLHNYIYAVLKKQLLIGQGSHELEILKYFYFATWNKQVWNMKNENIITIRNHSGKPASLILKHEPDAEKMMTGLNLTANDIDDRSETFYIPAQGIFVWFVIDGDYILSPNLNEKKGWDRKLVIFEDKKISVKNFNATINLY